MRPLASLSLDLDDEWSYLKTHGDPGWAAHPSYLDRVVPRFLEMLDELGLRITVFIVGRDAGQPENAPVLRRIAEAGHEIGNHSLRHEPWLHLYSETEIEDELREAEERITAATGVLPRGFRGPGYSLSEATLRVLLRRGYAYDASTLPTYLGPLARLYYFRTARLDPEERARRGALFGTLADGRRPLAPYRWRVDGGSVLEIPVTTLPGLRIPFHLSYVLYASVFAPPLAEAYFSAALAGCRAAGVEPSLLLHPLDFLGAEDAPSLSFFPAMRMPAEVKLRRVRRCLERFAGRFDVRAMGDYAATVDASRQVPLREPDFPLDRPRPER